MDVREFPVLTDEDGPLVDRFSAGLGETAARVLAYLSRRRAVPSLEPSATLLAVRIGAGLGAAAARDALADLESGGLVERTTIDTTTPGRPPDAWRAVASRAESTRRTYERHARRLLEQAERFDEPTADRSDGGTDDDRTDAPLTIGLNWRPNALHAPLFAARHADVGSVDAVEAYDGSNEAVGAVAAGTVDVGVAGAATILRERARGRPIVPIALLFQRSPVVLYTTRAVFGEPFEELAQLRGRRLGTPPGAETDLLGRLLLEQAGVRDAVDVVELEGEEQAALRAGEIDVATGAYPDMWRMERAGESVDAVPVAQQYPVYGPALIARRADLCGNRSRLESILAAATTGWADAIGEAAAVAELEGRSAESADRIERTFSLAVDRFGTNDAVDTYGWGWHTAEEWRNLHDALAQGAVL